MTAGTIGSTGSTRASSTRTAAIGSAALTTEYLLGAIHLEARHLSGLLLDHPYPPLRALFVADPVHADGPFRDLARDAYVRLLRLSADYVRFTVLALEAAGNVLRGRSSCRGDSDGQDALWSACLLRYARDEIDEGTGHEVWAWEDMAAIGAPAELAGAGPRIAAVEYGRYFVDEAARHPYAVLGAKGVLENLSIRAARPLLAGVARLGIAAGSDATRFARHHGVLDEGHVREAEADLAWLDGDDRRRQILDGAYVTSGMYRHLLHHYFPPAP